MMSRPVSDARTKTVTSALLVLWVMIGIVQARAELSGNHLDLDTHMGWRSGSGVSNPTDAYTLDRHAEGLRVEVLELGHGVVLNMPVPLYIDTAQTPILTMTYRATGLDLSNPDDMVVAFWGGKPDNFPIVRSSDIHADGQRHSARIDLRNRLTESQATDEALAWLDLRIRAADQGPAVFELFDLRFEPADDAPPSTAEEHAPDPVRVRVTDSADRPIADAHVVLDSHTLNHRVTATTDTMGLATLTPATPGLNGTRISLHVTKPGMTEMTFRDLHKVDAETVLLAKLFETQTLSGRAVDEQGEPIANAVGTLWYSGLDYTRGPGRPINSFRRSQVTTDDDGKWTSPPAPSDPNLNAQIRWTTPGYIQDQWGGQYSGKVTMEALKTGQAVSTLKRGVTLSGVVTDAEGNPIENAKVAQGDDRFPSNAPPATVTDSSGAYHFKAVAPGSLVLTVTAEGHAPELLQTQAVVGMDPIDFTLSEPGTFRFRVVDEQGNPLDAISFSADTWRGFRTLVQNFKTDAKGEATWQGPSDQVQFDIYARDYMRQEVTTGPSADENDVTEVVMHGPVIITAEVIDVETGKPVDDFNVVMGILWRNDGNEKPYWQRDMNQVESGNAGHWEKKFTHNYPWRVVRIEAEGYAPASSEPISKDSGSIDLSFQLDKAEPMTGSVVNDQDDPAAGVTVYLASGRSMPQIINGRIGHDRRECMTSITDDEGGFSFPPQDDDYLLIVLTDMGYAEMDAQQLTDAKGVVSLMPWVTVKGQMLIGDKPQAGGQVNVWLRRAYDPKKQRPHHTLNGTTDEKGYFSIDRVPAGPIGVGRHLKLSDRSWTTTNSEYLEAQPGETIEVKIGGTGRPVVGHFAWPDEAEAVSFSNGHRRLSEKVEHVDFMALQDEFRPDGFKLWDEDKQKAWLDTDEGKQSTAKLKEAADKFNNAQRNNRSYNFAIDPGGKFRVDNVQPGTYQLSLQVHKQPPANQCGWGDEIARLNVDVVVPPLPDGLAYYDEPLDTGTHTVEMIKPAPKVGEMAPDFTAPLLDLAAEDPAAALENADNLTLSDLKGKFVLLDFWATWCGPCVTETPNLKATWETFGEDDRFVIVALSLDQAPKAPTDYANKNDITWPQVYLGEWGKHPVMNDYAVRGIPSIWLIGPDGKIVAKGLRGENIKRAVAEAMVALPQ